MRVRAEDLSRHLAGALAPVYLVSGDEPLLVEEACDAVRAAARARGFMERISFHVDASFNWNSLAQTASSMSLFAELRLIEARLTASRPGEEGARALAEYAVQPAAGNLLLISMPQLDGQAQKSKWFKALDGAGVVMQLWPPGAGQLPGWVARRMRDRGLQPDDAAVALLAERVEGNLLAGAQEIEKILLLHGAGPVDAAAVMAAAADSARFDVFDLVDNVLAGDAARCIRILRGLQGEGVEPPLVLWALTRAIRFHAHTAAAIARGENLQALLQGDRAWSRRQGLVQRALQRHGMRSWWSLLRRAARVDRVIKGQAAGNVWDELLQLGLSIAGIHIGAPARQER